MLCLIKQAQILFQRQKQSPYVNLKAANKINMINNYKDTCEESNCFVCNLWSEIPFILIVIPYTAPLYYITIQCTILTCICNQCVSIHAYY